MVDVGFNPRSGDNNRSRVSDDRIPRTHHRVGYATRKHFSAFRGFKPTATIENRYAIKAASQQLLG
jgi:hypothetical protein